MYTKNIFIYWEQNFKNAPYIVKKCLESWKLKNPDWNIIELNDENLKNYINIEIDIPNIKKKNISKTTYSDIIRIFLLDKYGGCWCDATTYCVVPLTNWLNNQIIKSGFFAFSYLEPNSKHLLSSWFLYSAKNNYLIKKWKQKFIEYWNKNNKANDYFIFHNIFKDLYNTDYVFKFIWDSSYKIDTKISHYIQHPNTFTKN
jgi:hypothetical protein